MFLQLYNLLVGGITIDNLIDSILSDAPVYFDKGVIDDLHYHDRFTITVYRDLNIERDGQHFAIITVYVGSKSYKLGDFSLNTISLLGKKIEGYDCDYTKVNPLQDIYEYKRIGA